MIGATHTNSVGVPSTASQKTLVGNGRVLGEPTGISYDIQRYSIHDGPGIRTLVFLKGCPLRCPWCHNTESWLPGPEIRVFESRCIDDGSCRVACPLGEASGATLPDPARCLRCGRCAAACPTGARQLVGRRLTVSDVLGEVERDRPFYDESGGGVTFSGGEPLFQARFLLACLAEARRRGLNTAVETSGFASLQVIRRAALVTDLFLFDLKLLDPARHLRFTGAPLEPILRNLYELDRAGAEIWLRVPLVPGYTDDRENLEAIGRVVAGLRQTRRVHLLPYHKLGSDKFARLGRPNPIGQVAPPSAAAVEAAATLLNRFGLDVRVGG